MEQIISFSIIAGLVISFFFLFAIFKDKNTSILKKVSFALCLFIFFTHLHAYATLHATIGLFYISYLFDYTFFWIAGPLIYIYVVLNDGETACEFRPYVRHFIPGLLMFLLIFIPKFINELFSFNYFAYLVYYQDNQIALLFLRNVFFLAYIVGALKSIITRCQKTKLFSLLIGVSIVVACDLLLRILPSSLFDLSFDSGYITLILMTILSFVIGLSVFKFDQFGFPSPKNSEKVNSLIPITDEELYQLDNKLNKVMKEEKFFRHETLSLKLLAERLGVSDKKLSRLLNEGMQTNFKDYINNYRVEEVKSKLLTPDFDKFTLMGIASDSGFNSKASFYRIFKKHVGLTPKEYRNKNL